MDCGRTGAAALAVGALIMLSACSAPATTDSEGHVLLVSPDRPTVWLAARVAGDLALVGDQCFGLDMGELGTHTVVFPAGSRVSADDEVVVPGLGALSLGDPVDGGGGYFAADALAVAVPAPCASGEVAVLNPFD